MVSQDCPKSVHKRPFFKERTIRGRWAGKRHELVFDLGEASRRLGKFCGRSVDGALGAFGHQTEGGAQCQAVLRPISERAPAQPNVRYPLLSRNSSRARATPLTSVCLSAIEPWPRSWLPTELVIVSFGAESSSTWLRPPSSSLAALRNPAPGPGRRGPQPAAGGAVSTCGRNDAHPA